MPEGRVELLRGGRLELGTAANKVFGDEGVRIRSSWQDFTQRVLLWKRTGA